MTQKKTIIITGASRGIGKAIALKLLQNGDEIIGISRSHTIDHENYIPIEIDLSALNTLPGELKKISQDHEKVDALICNAGIWHYSHFEELSFGEMQKIINVNFLSQIFAVKAFLPQMKREKRGDIIFIGSESAHNAPAKQSVYGASKSALDAFAKSLRSECATQNIRITTIHPGSVKTEMLQIAPFALGEDPMHAILPEDIAALISQILDGRLGTVIDQIRLSPQKHHIQRAKT